MCAYLCVCACVYVCVVVVGHDFVRLFAALLIIFLLFKNIYIFKLCILCTEFTTQLSYFVDIDIISCFL